jgi:hypothetical protein
VRYRTHHDKFNCRAGETLHTLPSRNTRDSHADYSRIQIQGEDSVRIVHISDLHISEHLLRAPDRNFKLPHRYGHDVQVFLALDMFLKNLEWDLLLITGDVSRIGNLESFEWIRNWLQNELHFGNIHVGLNLARAEDRRWFIIPGNHDRFNGQLTQGSLDLYHQEFPVVRSGSSTTVQVGQETVNIHFFDSTTSKGGFAFGRIDHRNLIPKILSDNEIDIAMLHHHFLQPPKHPREISTELTNSSEVAAYMLNTGFDAIFFGHTHKSYIGWPSVDILSGMLNDKRRKANFFRRLIPRFVMRQVDDECLVSYKREAAKNGQLPTLESFFNYLYLSHKRFQLKGPAEFDSIREFYAQMDAVNLDHQMSTELVRIKAKRILISLAPSACQAEAEWKGFHVINVGRDKNNQLDFIWDRYEFDGATFERKMPEAHVA